LTTSLEGLTGLLSQVPAAVDRVRREIVLARFLGKLAVDQSARELRQRLDAALNSASVPNADAQRAPQANPRSTEPAASRSSADGRGAAPADASTSGGVASSLALSDYDHLPASDIVGKLSSLDASERDAIEAYERAGRARRTVLGKLEQLKGHA
jgi:hypothetical protein